MLLADAEVETRRDDRRRSRRSGESGCTEDRLLGGRVRLRQPAGGYRVAIDPIFLAASVPAEPHQLVLDVGCGAGAAMLCLAARVPHAASSGSSCSAISSASPATMRS